MHRSRPRCNRRPERRALPVFRQKGGGPACTGRAPAETGPQSDALCLLSVTATVGLGSEH